MLRYLGVPARVAVGFSSGTYDAKSGVWTRHRSRCARVGGGVVPRLRLAAVRPDARGPTGPRPAEAPYAAAVDAVAAGIGSVACAPLHRSANLRQSGHRHGETPGTGVRGLGTPARSAPSSSHGSLLVLLALVLGGALAAIVAAKLVVRRARYLTRDPRRVAAACRRELADFLLDQHIDAARSATLYELGALVRDELSVEPDAFVAAANAARFGPPGVCPRGR